MSFRLTALLALCAFVRAADIPAEQWAKATPAEAGLDEARLNEARDYALTGGGSGCIVRGGRLVFSWGDQAQRYDLKSTTKSFGAAALGLAIADGKVRLADKARAHHPTLGTPPESNVNTGWLDAITILHLASQTAGFDKPGGHVPLLFKPGTEWAYSDSGPNWLAECLTLAYRRDLDELMFERIFTPLGIGRGDLVWRKNSYRPDLIDGIKRREFGAGISANVDAMARFGLLWLRGGEWNGARILPRDFVEQARTTVPGVPGLNVRVPEQYGAASNHYGLLWWNNADETIEGLPLDAYWTWGLYDSLIVVMPSLDLVVARAGQSWKRAKDAGHYDVLKPFLLPIVAAAGAQKDAAQSVAPYPPSAVIRGIEWAPPDTILRMAKGSVFSGDDHFAVRRGSVVVRDPPAADAPYFPPPESQGGWRVLEKAEDIRSFAGMDPAKLDELRAWLLQSDNRPFAAVVIRRGHVVLQVERGNSAATDSRRVASVSKAVCATVLAIASEWSQQGRTPRRMTFADRAFDFIPWAQPLSDPRKAEITVRQLFNHTSGLCPEATGAKNEGSWEYVLGHTGDPKTAQLAFDPGTVCGYSTHALHHAALVCETVTGKPYDHFAIEALLKPIGCERLWFEFFDGGAQVGRHPSHSIGLPARDLARIGYCMLRDGRWADRQIIPKWFVDETAAPTHDVRTPELRFKINAQVFSHGWQLPALLGDGGAGIPRDARYKPGSGGQLIAFVPSLDLVIARQTGSSGSWEYEEFLRRACAAVLEQR